MANSSKRVSKEKYKDNNDDKKKNKQCKLFLKDWDNNPMFDVKGPGEKYTDTLILLGDKIYSKNVPNAVKGKFFKSNAGK